MNIIVIGGGAAGFFSALSIKKKVPDAKVVILEKTRQLLAKVKISGGGRCNVTHACFDPEILAAHYPRGREQLRKAFDSFQPEDTVRWFNERGVQLKTEPDGRIFPTTDSSETIIKCFFKESAKLGILIKLEASVDSISKNLEVSLKNGERFPADKVILATGSSPQGHLLAKNFGHTVVDPVPSLFTFNCPSSTLLELSGIAVKKARVRLENFPLEIEGPVLLTHWGFSGPAILRLSAFAARYLHAKDYKENLIIDWQPDASLPVPKNLLKEIKSLHEDRYVIEGKSIYKAEFVTAGGINLDEVDFSQMESKLQPNLHFAGEVLDIDGVTGGFNFQNAWTTGYLISNSIAEN